MNSACSARRPQGGRLRAVLGDRRLQPVAATLLLHGISQGMTVPLIALWILRDYGRGPGSVAAYFAATAAGGLLLNPLLGRWSDRLRRRRPVAILAACMQTVGMASLALHPPFALVLAVAACLIAAQVQPPLFALVNDHVGAGSARLPRAFTMATLRGAISGAWVIGAPAGGLLALWSLRLPFALGAVLNAGALALVLLRCREAPAPAPGGPAPAPSSRPRYGQLLLFSLATALALAGNTAKMQAVPLYLSRLGLGAPGIGGIYAWMALSELVLLPPWGALADRIPRRRAVAIGILGGAVFFLAVAVRPGTVSVLAAFPAMALFVAGLYGVGLGYVQELDPEHPGLAGGLFFAAQGLGQMAGGPLIAAGEAHLGLPHAFLIPGVLIVAAAGAVWATRPARHGAPPATPAVAAAPIRLGAAVRGAGAPAPP